MDFRRRRARILVAAVAAGVGLVSLALVVLSANESSVRVYRIGADHAAPFYFLRPDGSIEGLGYEAMEAAARIAGIKLQWVPVPEGPTVGMAERRVDIWPAAASTPERRARYYVAEAWIWNSFVLITSAEQTELSPRNFGVRRLTFRESRGRTQKILDQYFVHAERRPSATREIAIQEVCAGRADAMMGESRFAEALLIHRPPGCEKFALRIVPIPDSALPLHLIGQPEAASGVRRLQRALGQLERSGELARIVNRWTPLSARDAGLLAQLQREEMWIRITVTVAIGAVLTALIFFWQFRRAQQARREAQQAQLRAERASQVRGEFLANMSHEIRTPLSGVIGLTDTVLDGPLDEQARPHLELVRGSARLLLTVLNDVLDFSKLEAGQVHLESIPFSPAQAVRDSAALLEGRARTKGLDFRVEISPDCPPWVRGDPYRFQQIVMNFVSNAIKFTEQGSVTLALASQAIAPDRASFAFTVRDTGLGISKADQGRLFQKFSQADSSMTRRFGGTGLGLAIVEQLARLMGGRPFVESEEGRGSLFGVVIPFALAEAMEVSPPAPAADVDGLHVLLVEDNAVNRLVAERLLAKLGCRITVATDGMEAIDHWRAARPDLILMDCQMPHLDGYQATMIIRAEESQERVPIIALTAHALLEEEARCRQAGMDDFLTKPIDPHRLHQALAQWDRRCSAGLRAAVTPIAFTPTIEPSPKPEPAGRI